MELRIGRKVQAPKGPTNSSPAYRGMKTRGIRKSQRITTDPGGVDHQATIPKRLGDPARVLDEVLSKSLPWVGIPRPAGLLLDSPFGAGYPCAV